jgi:phage gpG-like protein
VRIELSLFGDVQMSREILRVSERAGNMDPVFRSIFGRLKEINAEQIISHGQRSGGWEELKPATILAKARAGMEHPDWPEYGTGDLFRALSHTGDENNEEIYNRTWAVFRVTGDPGEYGPIQQRGTVDGSLPARPLFALTEVDRREFVREMEAFLFTGTVRGFFF